MPSRRSTHAIKEGYLENDNLKPNLFLIAAAYASAAKTSHVAIDAAALQAVNGISSLGNSANANFGAGFGGGHYGR